MPSEPTMALLDEIEEKAKAATPGSHHYGGCSTHPGSTWIRASKSRDPVASDCDCGIYARSRPDPDTILALVRVARAATALLDGCGEELMSDAIDELFTLAQQRTAAKEPSDGTQEES